MNSSCKVISSSCKTPSLIAYGVEPGRMPYSLRLSRYQAIGETVNIYARLWAKNKSIRILDVGGDEGRALRYIEAYPTSNNIKCDIADLFPDGTQRVYKKEQRDLFQLNFETQGLKSIADNSYDIVVCEQVMEHLVNPEFLATEIFRVLKKDGIAIIGVPIFPEGIHLIRKVLVPKLDKLFLKKKQRSHVQAFSLRTFNKLLKSTGEWKVIEKRGFRIISGGILRKLELYKWWWKINKTIGGVVPSMCIEAQIVLTKK